MRLIDADALSKKLCETTIFIKDGEKFQHMINDAPTIEPDGDTISRQDAIDVVEKYDFDFPQYMERFVTELRDAMKKDIVNDLNCLPSAETHDIRTETHGVCSDLISRGDAVALVIKAIHGTNNKEIKEYLFDGLRKQMWSLPSAPDSRQRGEWVEVEDYDGDVHYQCDQCENEFILIDGTPKDNNYHFCPNCGADMRGEEE